MITQIEEVGMTVKETIKSGLRPQNHGTMRTMSMGKIEVSHRTMKISNIIEEEIQ